MTTTNNGDRTTALPWTRDQLTPEEFRLWVASREEAGREIDIETCELGSWYTLDFDPYGADPDLPEEWRRIRQELLRPLPLEPRMGSRP